MTAAKIDTSRRNSSLADKSEKSPQPRHEPGRYFAGIGFDDPGPHFQDVICLPASAAPTAAVVPMNGVRSTVFVSMFAESIPWAVTVTLPAVVVSIFATYFEALVADSQPNEFAAGNAVELAD